MIHVVTLEPFEPEEMQIICRALSNAYGVGCEPSAELTIPEEALVDGQLDAEKLLAEAEPIKTFADDKILYLVKSAFRSRESPAGLLPTHGCADYGKERAVASTEPLVHGASDVEARAARMAKLSVHQVGHLWDLHHCIDVRCSMTPPWGVNFAQSWGADLCAFCREKSERRMKTTPA